MVARRSALCACCLVSLCGTTKTICATDLTPNFDGQPRGLPLQNRPLPSLNARMLEQADIAIYNSSRYDNDGSSRPGFVINFRKKADYEAVLLQCFNHLPAFDELDSMLKEKAADFEGSVGLTTEEKCEQFYDRRWITPMWAFSAERTNERPYSVSCELTNVTIRADYFNELAKQNAVHVTEHACK